MTQSGRSLAGKQCPRAHSQQRINYRECQKKARKHTSNGERNQYRRDEDQSVDDGSNNELSRSRATTKEESHPITTTVRPTTRISACSWPAKGGSLKTICIAPGQAIRIAPIAK